MKKYIVLLFISCVLASCGNKESLQEKIEVQDNKKQEVVGEKKNTSVEKDDNLQEKDVNQDNTPERMSYKIKQEGDEEILYMMKDGEKIKVDSNERIATIENIEFYKDFLVYDWGSTGGTMKKVFDVVKMKEVGKVFFGKLVKKADIIYGCEEAGMGGGTLQVLNLNTLKKRDFLEEFNNKSQGSSVFACSFDEEKLKMIFAVKQTGEKKKYNYDVKSDTLQEEKQTSQKKVEPNTAQYDYKIEEKDRQKILYIIKEGKKIKVDTTPGLFENIEVREDYIIYDWISTGGAIKTIFDTNKMEEISRINFGTWDKTKRFVYSCQEGGYGPGYVQVFDFDTKKSKDLFKDFYEKNDDAVVLSCNFDEKALQIHFTIDDNGEKSYNYDITADILKQLEK